MAKQGFEPSQLGCTAPTPPTESPLGPCKLCGGCCLRLSAQRSSLQPGRPQRLRKDGRYDLGWISPQTLLFLSTFCRNVHMFHSVQQPHSTRPQRARYLDMVGKSTVPAQYQGPALCRVPAVPSGMGPGPPLSKPDLYPCTGSFPSPLSLVHPEVTSRSLTVLSTFTSVHLLVTKPFQGDTKLCIL